MGKIELDTLALHKFDRNNKDHLEFFKKLLKQKDILKRVQGMGVGLLHNHADEVFFDRGYFVGDNEDLVGYLNIGKFNKEEEAVYLRTAVDKDKRGNNYGIKILNEVTDYIFMNHREIKKIKLKIASDNIYSTRVALACGYKIESFEFFYSENPYILQQESNIEMDNSSIKEK